MLVDNLAVDPEWQNRGALLKCYHHVKDEARRLKLRTVKIYTNEKLTRNISMYQRLGFRITHRREFVDRTFVYMEFDLLADAKAPANAYDSRRARQKRLD
jgi:ribosomal protein S18 acetylase RimI-like enzyme